MFLSVVVVLLEAIDVSLDETYSDLFLVIFVDTESFSFPFWLSNPLSMSKLS